MERVPKRRGGQSPAPALLMTLLALALPAAGADSAAPAAAAEPASGDKPLEADHWPVPTFRMSGALGLEARRDKSEEQQHAQTSVVTSLNVAANTYLWEPWFARLDGNVGLTMSRDNSHSHEIDSQNIDTESQTGSRSLIMTGSLRLSILAQSRTPFEFHFDRNDSRVATELALNNGYTSQRFGFTQHYLRNEGDSMVGWDHNTQTSEANGRDRQDSLQLSMTHAIEEHRLQLLGDATRNVHEHSGESATQENLSLQHSYTPSSVFSLESMANFNRSAYDLHVGQNRTGLAQLSTMALWRPEEQPLTVTGGARLFALGVDTTGQSVANTGRGSHARNLNLNGGASYDLSPAARLFANANENLVESAGARSINANQTVGASYQPPTIDWGNTHYGWSASANGSNRSGGQETGRQLSAQLNHNLTRVFRLNEESSMAADVGQGLTAVALTNAQQDGVQNSRQVTHGGSISYDTARESGTATIRLSASDARTLDGKREFFQMVNLQAASNLNSGVFSSWSGSLTVQAVRQGFATEAGKAALQAQLGKSFVPTSSAALTYQHQRLFGLRNLRFTSDLRINGQTLFPVLASVQDQETAAWENRLDYSIGRLRLRVNMLVARSNAIYTGTSLTSVSALDARAQRTNRSVMFSLTRAFGSN
jgi:hypothetical protein